MAVIPGTRYAEGTLPGSTGQVPMPAPQQDNRQAITSVLSQAGRALMNYAQDVQNKKMVAETSQKKREIDEAGWAANEAISGNDEADKKVREKFQQTIQRIASSSEYKDVNSLLQQHINSSVPNWEHAFRVKSLSIQEQEAIDQLKLNRLNLLSYGDIDGANKIADNALRLKAITQAEYDDMIKNAPIESHLQIANRLLDDANNSEGKKDYQAVLDELDKTKDMSLDPKQRQNREALKLTAERAKGDVNKATINKYLDEVIKGNKSINDILDEVKAEENLDATQKTEIANTILKTEKVWRDEGTNYLNETRDPDKLAETYDKIKRKEITTYEQLYDVFKGDGTQTPPFSFGWLINLEAQRMSVTGSGKADRTEANFRFRLLENFQDKQGRMSDSARKQHKIADDKLTQLLADYSDPNTRETKFQELLSEVKQVEAKKYLTGFAGIKKGLSYVISPRTMVSDILTGNYAKGSVPNPVKPEMKKPESKYQIGQIVTLKDGTKYKITGFDDDGTPKGEPVK